MPCGRKIIRTTRATPKTNTRYSLNSRNTSGRMTITAAPRMEPAIEPIPPTTTIRRMKIELRMSNVGGLMKLACSA
jgi:hypothetical protein